MSKPTAPLSLRLFGPFSAEVRGSPLPPARTRTAEWVLALLALQGGRVVERAWLAGLLWPDSGEDQGLRNLRNSLSHLRDVLGPESGRLHSPTRSRLGLDLEGAEVDLLRFDALRREGSEAAQRQAVALYTAPLLASWQEEWLLPERAARAEACLSSLETLADTDYTRGDYTAALSHLQRAVLLDPLRDTTQRLLLRVLAARGETPAALLAFREYRTRLHQELNTEPDPETTRLFQEIREKAKEGVGIAPRLGPVAPQGPRGLGVRGKAPNTQRPSSLPHPLTSLIGREETLRDVAAVLEVNRLVTLVGGGGVGKTRLSIEAARLSEPRFAEGAAFLSLATLSDPALLLSFAVQALGLREESAEPEALLSTLVRHLAAREILLVFDNCEHLLDAAAHLAQALLDHCPHVRILATSRVRLALTGEQVWRVPSLPAPDTQAAMPAGQDPVNWVLQYAAVQLFMARAAQVAPRFRITRAEEAAAVGLICHRLDGIPLAIELAAARVGMLDVRQIAARLDNRFRLLTGGSRTVLPRHQTLRTLVDWSYDLLSPQHQTLLCRLSVFAGGWTLEAAEAVAADFGAGMNGNSSSSRLRNDEVLDLLSGLVEHSLVGYEVGEEGGRYRLLETIREYARDRLEEHGDEDTVRRRHRDYFLALAEAAHPELVGPDQVAWLNRLQREHENMRAALAFCRRTKDGIEAGMRLASGLRRFWAARGYLSEGREHLHALLDGDERAGQPEDWLQARARAVYAVAFLARDQNDLEIAERYAERSDPLWQALGCREGIGNVRLLLGLVRHDRGDIAGACDYYQRALEIFREMGDRRLQGLMLYNLGDALSRSERDTAMGYYREALEIARQAGDRRGESLVLHSLAWLTLELGNLEEGREWERASFRLRVADGGGRGLVELLDQDAALSIEEGRYRRGVWLYGACSALEEQVALAGQGTMPEPRRQRLAKARAALGESAYAAVWAEGRSAPLEQVVARARTDPAAEESVGA